MKKNFLNFIITSITITAILVGCNSSSSTDATSENSNNTETTNSLSYEVLAVRGTDSDNQYLEGFVKESQDKVGISVEWNIQRSSDWADKKAVFLTNTDDLPDAFFGGNSLNDADVQKNAGLFIPLEDLIEENMPNFKKVMEADPKIKSLITSTDGHIYTLPKKMPGRPIVGNQLFINQSWLDNLGLSMPTTYKELEDVLAKFLTEDPNQNGIADEIPMLGQFKRLLTIYGVQLSSSTTLFMNWNPETNEAIYNPTTENYKNAINHFNELFNKQLLDNELFTNDSSQMNAKNRNESIAIVGVSEGWVLSTFAGNADEYTALPALEAPDGNKYVMMDQNPYGRNQFAITYKCENPADLLKWIDEFYTEDATVATYYGDFGKATEKNDDGTYTILPGKDMSQSTYSEIMAFRDEGPKWVPEGFTDRLIFETLDGDGGKLALTKDLEPYAVENYPLVMYTDEEQARLSTLTTDIEGFVKNKQAEWVSNNGVSDEEWNAYIEQLKQMGLDEFLTIHQSAIDRYVANSN